MNLAITLLVTVGIASLVGTVPRQNEPYQAIWPASVCLNHLRVT
jgi:cytochrome c biogenesis protein ResB